MAYTGELVEHFVGFLKERVPELPGSHQSIDPDPALRAELRKIEGLIEKSTLGNELRKIEDGSKPEDCKCIRVVRSASSFLVSIPNPTTGTCDWILYISVKIAPEGAVVGRRRAVC